MHWTVRCKGKQMATHEITVTLQVRSKHSAKAVRRLLELCMCDTGYSHSEDDGPHKQFRIVGVDAGVNPRCLSADPYEFEGQKYPHIVDWRRAS